jgi:hypothetical protein
MDASTNVRSRVQQLLRLLISEGAAAFFADAWKLAEDEYDLRSTTHIVAHLLRECESSTRQVLLHFPGVTENLQTQSASDEPSKTAKRDIKAILNALGLSDTSSVSINWLNFHGAKGLQRLAHRASLRSPRPLDSDYLMHVQMFTQVLHELLTHIESRYVDVIRNLEKHLAVSPPSAQDIAAVAPYLATGVTALSHIFDRLDGAWLIPLRKEKVFQDPPNRRLHEGDAVSFPGWPQASYLVRVADKYPAEVAATVKAIPRVDNEWIHARFLEAAVKMPGSLAAGVAFHEAAWISSIEVLHGLVPHRVAELCRHLLSAGQLDATLALLHGLLPLSDEEPRNPWEKSSAKFGAWEYERLVQKIIPELSRRFPDQTRTLLIELVADRDFSAVSDRRTDEPLGVLAAQLCDLYIALGAANPDALALALDELDRRGKPLYQRFALDLLRAHGDLDSEQVARRLCEENLLTNNTFQPAMEKLLSAQFTALNEDQQDRVLSALRAVSSEASVRRDIGDEVEGDVVQHIAKQRLQRWLHALGEHRQALVEAEYRLLVAEIGPPLRRGFQVMVGRKSPATSAELVEMEDSALLAYLRNWKPASADLFEDSVEGLARELGRSVEQHPVRFSRVARDIRELDAAYVGSVVSGLYSYVRPTHRAAGGDTAILTQLDWDSILDLLAWVVGQSASDDSGHDIWAWVRRSTSEVARAAISAGIRDSDQRTIERSWAIVSELMRDSDPVLAWPATSSNGDQLVASEPHDVDEIAINTVRGNAISVAFDIAAELSSGASCIPHGLRDEVVRRLCAIADPSIEPHLALRLQIPLYFNSLCVIDAEAASKLAPKLFPTSTEANDSQRIAWRLYLKHNAASKTTFHLLEASYQYAVGPETIVSDEALSHAVGVHLVVLATRHVFDFRRSDANNLLYSFPTTCRCMHRP